MFNTDHKFFKLHKSFVYIFLSKQYKTLYFYRNVNKIFLKSSCKTKRMLAVTIVREFIFLYCSCCLVRNLAVDAKQILTDTLTFTQYQ